MSSATPITARVPPRATRFHGTPVSPPAVGPVVRRDVVKSCDIHAPDHAAEQGPPLGAPDSTNMTGRARRDRSGPLIARLRTRISAQHQLGTCDADTRD